MSLTNLVYTYRVSRLEDHVSNSIPSSLPDEPVSITSSCLNIYSRQLRALEFAYSNLRTK